MKRVLLPTTINQRCTDRGYVMVHGHGDHYSLFRKHRCCLAHAPLDTVQEYLTNRVADDKWSAGQRVTYGGNLGTWARPPIDK